MLLPAGKEVETCPRRATVHEQLPTLVATPLGTAPTGSRDAGRARAVTSRPRLTVQAASRRAGRSSRSSLNASDSSS